MPSSSWLSTARTSRPRTCSSTGSCPDEQEAAEWQREITHHTLVHENIKQFIDGFHHDAHPMGILVNRWRAVHLLPAREAIFDTDKREHHVKRLIAKMPTLAAFAYRHSVGLPYDYPDNHLSFAGNFLNMMFKMVELKYRARA